MKSGDVLKSCFFIGHRDAPESMRPALERTVERHIVEFGVTEFVVGHYGSFDRMAARAVMKAKSRHPAVRLTLLLPYHPAVRPFALHSGYDDSYYPPGMEQVPPRLAIVQANRYMVEEAEYLIAFVRYTGGNAGALVALAEKRGGIHITRLDEEI